MWCEFVCILKKLPTLLSTGFISLVRVPRSPFQVDDSIRLGFTSTPPCLCGIKAITMMAILLKKGDRRTRIVPVCRTNKEQVPSPPMFKLESVKPMFKFEFGQPEPSRIHPNCDCSWSRFCCSSWSRLIWSSTGVRCCDWRSFRLLLISMLLVVLRCNCVWSCSAGASENAWKSNKNGKKSEPNIGSLVSWMAWSFGSKQNQTKTWKNDYKHHVKGWTLVWAKHKNVKKQLQPNKHGKNLENHNEKLAAYVSADLVGRFFDCSGMNELAVVGLWCCRGPFPFCRLVRSIHPVWRWILDGWIFLPSSDVGSDSQLVCQLRVGMDYFVLNPVHVPVSVKWMWKSGGELCQCIRCHYYSVHQDNENQAFILQPCAMVGLDNNTLSKRKPMVKKNGEAQMRRKGKSQMEWQW